LEVAVLDRGRKRDRKFRRIVGAQLARLLADEPGADEAAISDNGNGDSGGAGAAAGGEAQPPASGAAAEGASATGAAAQQGDILDDIDEVLEDGDGEEGEGGSRG
jgi:proteasome alpha subunit